MLRATVVTPWDEAELAQIAWAQFRDSLLITHPDVPPQQLKRASDTAWTIGPWIFAEIEPAWRSPMHPRFPHACREQPAPGCARHPAGGWISRRWD